MAYGDFDVPTLRARFGLALEQHRNLFADLPEVPPSPALQRHFDRWLRVALASNSEKARSELIIAPILMEAVERSPGPVNLFSGINFDVDRARGLNGFCDYLLTASEDRYYPTRPVTAVAEGKREDVVGGLGQCAAAMLGAQLFNAADAAMADRPVYGATTTGTDWKFLRLCGPTLAIDSADYFLPQLPKILAVLMAMVGPATAAES